MDAVVVHGTPEWHARRSTTVGASEVAYLLAASRWGNARDLWRWKTGRAVREPSEAMSWGSRLEPVILAALRDEGLAIEPWQTWLRDSVEPRLSATPDAWYFDESGELVIVETKVTAQRPWGGPPLDYQLQVQAQLAVTGAAHGTLVVLHGGTALRMYPVPRHDGAIARIRCAVGEFWGYVERDEEPPETMGG